MQRSALPSARHNRDVTFDYRAVVHPDPDLHRADVAPSRAHGFRVKPGM